ncbi:13S globulin seed storage protein 3-like protein [Drosera capensis]
MRTGLALKAVARAVARADPMAAKSPGTFLPQTATKVEGYLERLFLVVHKHFRQNQRKGERGSERLFRNEHENIRHFREGDIVALPAGVTKWVYNDGDSCVIAVTLYDTSSFQNQLDERNFYLAGSRQLVEDARRERREGWIEESRNIFGGFDQELLAEALGLNVETVNQLQGLNDNRGNIVSVDRSLRILTPEYQEEEEIRREVIRRERRYDNGLEETFCNIRLRHNIDAASKPDIYNPQGGRTTKVTSNKFPILGHLQLSVERVVLYKNGIFAPHWTINAHTILYVTRGRGRVQVVGDNGRLVLNQEVQEGQLLVIPQNFVMTEKESEEGLEWVAFKTSDNAINTPLAGQASVIRSLPAEVFANSYLISRETARQLKQGRRGLAIFGPARASRRDAEIP